MLFWTELCLALLSLAIAFAYPELGSSWFARAEKLFNRLAQRRGLAVVTVGVAALALRAALLPILPVPYPAAQDEFGYLLLADTFSHGRLTNPPHPMWAHFESLYIIWHPTYTAMFYPGQGLIMALGQAIMGHPFWGVWLSVGLMCAAICWMLQGWLPPGWALLGGFLAVIRLGTFSYWVNSYWGGAVAATGGALVLGALPRIKRSRRVRDALMMGLGFAVVASSRPYEGLFFGLPVAGALAVWLWGNNRPPVRLAAKRVVVPLFFVLVLTGCAMSYYFWRTTGSPWVSPHLLGTRTYTPGPFFPWQSLQSPPPSDHSFMADFYRSVLIPRWKESRSVVGLMATKLRAALNLVMFYLGAALALPLLMAPLTRRYGFSWKDISPDTRFLIVVCASVIAGSMLPSWFIAHFAAPITCAVLALVLKAMRGIRVQRHHGRPTGLLITRAVPSICLVMLAIRACGGSHLADTWPGTWCSPAETNVQRAAILAKLERHAARQLAIVRYSRSYLEHQEWVYNEADIDSAKVLWARDMGPDGNRELINYFSDREVWLVEPDKTPPAVTPYVAPP
jgi:hypothetical protein